MGEGSPADRGREALGRHAWREAYDLLTEADRSRELPPQELELLAQAAWWVGRLPEAIDARERAYAQAVRAGQFQEAVIAAIGLGRDNLFRNSLAVANAWLNRAERHLVGQDEGVGHGWLAAIRSFHAALAGDSDRALEQATRAGELAARFGDRNLQAMALSEEGMALLAKGRVDEGLALVDEATAAAVGGELEPSVAGGVCCTTIEACAGLGDWRRAGEWIEAQDRWCRREGINGYPGMCRLFRSEIKLLRGAWQEAEAEARQASEELSGFIPAAVGTALYRIGEIKLRRGDLPAAEEVLLRAHGLGRSPEPALSLLRLAQGRTEQAAESIRRALAEPEAPAWQAPIDSPLHRLSLLPAQVEIAVAGADTATARAAADELATIAERYRSDFARAAAATAAGVTALAEHDPIRAGASLREAVRLWSEIDAPYEAARARESLARAYLAEAATEQSALELQAAVVAFERLGAIADLRRTELQLAELRGPDVAPVPQAGGERAIRTFMFTDIVDSTRLAELLGDDAWHELIRWHDQTLRAVVAEHGGEEVKETGDGFFLAFDDATRAVEAAIGIQRRLAEHRGAHGFAPAVRIGLHQAEATRQGLDYTGSGVNVAARIGAAAEAAEVLVSAGTLSTVRRAFAERGRRTLSLKGVAEAVEAVSLEWR